MIPLIVILAIDIIALIAKKEILEDAIIIILGICIGYMSILWWVCFWKSSMSIKAVPCCIPVLILIIWYIRSDTKSITEATTVVMVIAQLILIMSIK